MLRRLAGHHSGALACLALLVALGGTSYAAVGLPAGSVGTPQLRAGAVTSAKLASGAVSAVKVRRGSLSLDDVSPDALVAGPAGLAGVDGTSGAVGDRGPAGLPGVDGGVGGVGPAGFQHIFFVSDQMTVGPNEERDGNVVCPDGTRVLSGSTKIRIRDVRIMAACRPTAGSSGPSMRSIRRASTRR